MGLSSVTALANGTNPSLLWELMEGGYRSQETSGLQSLSHHKITANHNTAALTVTPNQAVFNELSIGQELRLQLPEKTESGVISGRDVAVRIVDSKQTQYQTIWTFKVLAEEGWFETGMPENKLPNGKLFVKDGGLSAWIPGAKGAWRLVDGVVRQEMKWASGHLDYRTGVQTRLNFINLSANGVATSTESGHAGNLQAVGGVSNSSPTDNEQFTQESGSRVDYGGEEFTAVVKVLFVYTPEFAQDQESVNDNIEQWLEVNNEIYEASGVKIRLEIAETLEAELEGYTSDQILDNLARVDNASGIDSGILNLIWETRLDSKADLVTVLTHERPDGVCGTSWLNGTEAQVFDYREAINLVSAYTRFDSGTRLACSMDTLGHEIGHNMGLAHSHEQGEQGSVFHYGRGYGVEDEFSTVMAYPQAFGDAVAVPFYSSPERECAEDQPCGVSSELSDGADAVKALNQVSARVARIHNEAVTMRLEEALEELDNELADCVADSHSNVISNEEVTEMNCPGSDVASLSGVERFPRLSFISVNRTDDISLEPFKRLQEVIALDFRFTRIEDLRPIAHLKNQLVYLQFFSENMSCQDEMVAASWGIDEFRSLRGCESRSDDEDDFDGDGVNNLNDVDDDNDGIDDLSDALPRDSSNTGDMDADGVPDERDAFPYDPEEFKDTDHDTLGNNEDNDDDNDGFPDDEDCAPLDPLRAEVCEAIFVPYDFDGDGKADVGVRRASDATQYILNSSDSVIQRELLGRQSTDIAISGDFDGDKIADLAVRRPSERMWYIRPSSDKSNLLRIKLGLQEQDIPVPADYDGDGITDVAVRRPSTFFWYVLRSSDGEIDRYVFGKHEGDIPVPADYDGDGLADIAVRRPGNQIWYILRSSDNDISRVNFGLQEQDIPVPADYDGDGITDIAVRRPSTQLWYILRSSDNKIMRVKFGLQESDIPIVADYDGDRKADIAVRRPSTKTQYILRSSDLEIERIVFGLKEDDMPLAAPVSVRFSTVASLSDKLVNQERPVETSEFAGMDIITTEQAIASGVILP